MQQLKGKYTRTEPATNAEKIYTTVIGVSVQTSLKLITPSHH